MNQEAGEHIGWNHQVTHVSWTAQTIIANRGIRVLTVAQTEIPSQQTNPTDTFGRLVQLVWSDIVRITNCDADTLDFIDSKLPDSFWLQKTVTKT